MVTFLYPEPSLLPNGKEKGSGSVNSGSPRLRVIQNAHALEIQPPVIKMVDF